MTFSFSREFKNVLYIFLAYLFVRGLLQGSQLPTFDKEKFIDAILENSNFCIFVKDAELKYKFVNSCTEVTFGIKEELILGKSDEELFASPFSKMSDLKVLKEGHPLKLEEVIPLPSGEECFFVAKSPLKNENGEVYGICSIAKTITEQKNTETKLNVYLEKLENLMVELMEMRILSEQASQTKNAFLANMNHELRTPLNAIIGNISLLYNESLSDKQEMFLNRIKKASEMLHEIIGQVLDFSKLEANELILDSAKTDLKELLNECYSILSSRAEEKNLKFILEEPDDLPLIFCDPIRLKQVLLNLLSNAIKFTEKGSVILKVSLLKMSENIAKIRFEINDTGIGISLEKQHHLFEKFWQADPSITRKYGGTGLGLAISKEIVSKMGGNISVKSEEGVGSKFAVDIPFSLYK